MNVLRTSVWSGPRHQLPTGKWARLKRGAYLNVDDMPEEMEPWRSRILVTEARAHALTRTCSNSEPIFTGEVGMLLRGIQCWRTLPDLLAWPGTGTGTNTRVSPGQIDTDRCEAASVSFRFVRGRRCESTSESVNGLDLAPPNECAIDAARFEHPLVAISVVSAYLRETSGLSNHNQDEARPTAEMRRRGLISQLEDTLQTPNCGALAVLDTADPGIASSGEAFAWWLLHSLVEPAQIRSQYRGETGDRTYFLGAALPDFGVCVETDGYGKFTSGKQSHREFLDRHTDLFNAGWAILRLTSADSFNPAQALRKVSKFLTRQGVPLQAPSKALWAPTPPKVTAPRWRY